MNEGLSHFAEELGWRAVPASQCGGDCFSDFMGGDIGNAYRYLDDPDAEYLIAPEAGDGTLPERGASWLFLRWLAQRHHSPVRRRLRQTAGCSDRPVARHRAGPVIIRWARETVFASDRTR